MKKANRKTKYDLRPECDFADLKGGVRGKYATHLVLLDPEIAKAFLHVVLDLTSQVPVRNPSRSRSSMRQQKSRA